MGEWDPDLHRRQAGATTPTTTLSSDAVCWRGRSVRVSGSARPVRGGRAGVRSCVPLTVLMVGLLLAFVGPVPGLGVFLVLGAAMATPVVLLTVWLG